MAGESEASGASLQFERTQSEMVLSALGLV